MSRSSQRQSKKPIPFDFVLEQLDSLSPITKPFFGCTGVYIGEKIVLILRLKTDEPEANGIWIATTLGNHESLRRELPSMRSIGVLGEGTTGWQLLRVDDSDFEESATRVCELILNNDPRIGKIPKQKSIKPASGSKRLQQKKNQKISSTSKSHIKSR